MWDSIRETAAINIRKRLIRIRSIGYRLLAHLESPFDKRFLAPDIPLAQDRGHLKMKDYIYELGNRTGMRVLEIGSREVTGPSDARAKMPLASYVGFDYYPGKNVDVVGDVHRLSSYFEDGDKFDIIYSEACLEHFAMPWIAAVEIAKMLKVVERSTCLLISRTRRMNGRGTFFSSATWD